MAAVVLAAAVGAVGLIGANGAPPAASLAPALPALGSVQVVSQLSLGAGAGATRRLPSGGAAVSFDVSLAPESRLELRLGSPAAQFILRRGPRGSPVLEGAGQSYGLASRPGWRDARWRHVELRTGVGGGLAVDGHSFPIEAPTGTRLAFRVLRGRAQVRALVITAAADRASLLFHRLAELHARLTRGAFPLGADSLDRLHLHSVWTTGFWPGALWQAAALEPAGGMFSRWALAATIAHFGLERSPTHDVGFMYGQSSLAAWRAICRMSTSPPVLCSRLKDSVLQAADELLALAAGNPGAGTIPTRAGSPAGETIVDSMMNIGILPWATQVTGNPAYARLASHQAHVIAALLVRPDGSTSQAVHFDRRTGRILFIGTHQGLSNDSTWARGQGWALYGFAQIAADLRDRSLLDVAQRLAGYVAERMAAGGVPPWDYNAPPGAPPDVSAGVMTAAGLLHLAAACYQFRGDCADPGQWVALARRMLAAALDHTQQTPPLGFLGSQVLDGRRHTCCNGSELIFGLTYALEGLRLERAVGPRP